MSWPRWTHPVHLVLGLTIWSLWFVVAYAVSSLGCQLMLPPVEPGPFNPVIATILAGGVLVTLGLLWAASGCWRAARGGGKHDSAAEQVGNGEQQETVASIATGLYLISAVAALAIILPGLVLPPCL